MQDDSIQPDHNINVVRNSLAHLGNPIRSGKVHHIPTWNQDIIMYVHRKRTVFMWTCIASLSTSVCDDIVLNHVNGYTHLRLHLSDTTLIHALLLCKN